MEPGGCPEQTDAMKKAKAVKSQWTALSCGLWGCSSTWDLKIPARLTDIKRTRSSTAISLNELS
jgi:hypothetical protein